jgi:5-dehydro-2-deoxygluconokinase
MRSVRRATRGAIVMKRGAEGCVVLDEAAESTSKERPVPGFPVEVMNVLGAGDAFLARCSRACSTGSRLLMLHRWATPAARWS